MEKRAYHHGDLRQSLIEGAIALIHQAGIRDLSLRQVARQAGVSHNAPYRHFEDKEALLAAVAQQGFQSLRSALEAAKQAAPPPPPQRLAVIGVAYVEFALANPAYYRVMFGEYRNNLNQYPDLAEAAQQAFRVLEDTIVEGQVARIFRPADPVDLAASGLVTCAWSSDVDLR